MHFAKVKNNIVEQVIVAEQEFIDTLPKEDGVSWLQTSFNTLQGKHYDPITKQEDDKPPLRGNYAGIGYCLLYTSPSPRDQLTSRMPSSA